jgi:predicted N-formylglutamate amidohydrolase
LIPDGLRIVFTCEHASPDIPSVYAKWFRGRLNRIPGHRVFDAGASGLAVRFARRFRAPLSRGRFSRLLTDLNRSERHPGVFSEFSRPMPHAIRSEILEAVHRPFRAEVAGRVDGWLRRGFTVVHVSVHTFAPRWNGSARRTDVGLLFDPGRRLERRICAAWRSALKAELPGRTVHFNRPYRGVSDGLTTFLRKGRPDGRYAGIEIEVNGKFFLPRSAAEGRRVDAAAAASLEKILSDLFGPSGRSSVRPRSISRDRSPGSGRVRSPGRRRRPKPGP